MDWWWSSPDCVNFLIGVCSITWFGLFVWLGFFLSLHLAWSAHPPRGVCINGGLRYLRRSALPPPARLLCASLGIPAPWGGALHREIYLAFLTDRLRRPWFVQGVFVTVFVVLLLPLRCAWLPRLCCPLLFEVTCLLALLWRACFTSDCLTGCVGRTSYWTPTFFSSTVSCLWSCHCSVLSEKNG